MHFEEIRAFLSRAGKPIGENDLFIAHLQALRRAQSVCVPVYDFATYVRTDQVKLIQPRNIILVEGILIFVDRMLRDLIDIKIYVDAPADLRFIRRLRRDTAFRGRSVGHVIEQYLQTVRPMHLEFVEPSKQFADIIIPKGGENDTAIGMVVAQIQRVIEEG